jgi:hypothetical protein
MTLTRSTSLQTKQVTVAGITTTLISLDGKTFVMKPAALLVKMTAKPAEVRFTEKQLRNIDDASFPPAGYAFGRI